MTGGNSNFAFLYTVGFMHESRDPLYDDYLKAVHDFNYADRPPMTQEQIEKRRLAMQALIKSLTEERGKAHWYT